MMTLQRLLAVGLTTAFLSAADPAPYTAHEWGTFTSVQGSDGQTLRWNPFTESDLPSFVHTRGAPARGPKSDAAKGALALLGGKESTHWLQRMETPVIYFHAEAPVTVSAHVEFPKGLITEWYPVANTYGPFFGIPGLFPATDKSFAHWTDLEILPRSTPLPPDSKTHPRESAPSHYYAARQARSNPVRTTRGVGATDEGKGETEQFLFYRGVADFASPIKVSNPGADLIIENTGRDPVSHLFVWEARGTKASLIPMSALAVGATHHTEGDRNRIDGERGAMTREFKYRLQTALVGDGLNPDEAAAMIQTWADSWFDEDGVRVLYLVPRAFTDSVLPLTLTPTPRALARVFVGRAEVLPAEIERKATTLATRFIRDGSVEAAREFGRLVVPRFTDSLIRRIESQELAATEAWLRVEPSLEPLERRSQAAQQKVSNEFAALRSAVGKKKGQ